MISRAASTVTYPSEFILLGAMNPCPCGYQGSKDHYCTCTPKQIAMYQNRLSGPILDRMDMFLQLTSVSLENDTADGNESSERIRERVDAARVRQSERYGTSDMNATVPQEMLMTHLELTREQHRMLQQWASKQHWSTRVQMSILRLARTIADLNGDEQVTNEALWEASTLRRRSWIKNHKAMGM